MVGAANVSNLKGSARKSVSNIFSRKNQCLDESDDHIFNLS